MTHDPECFERVCKLVASTLDVSPSELDAQNCAATHPDWDSLAHLMILTAVERSFAVSLPRLESYTVRNIGELVQLLERQIAGQA
jgi:acyl carrier protein